jgi:dihydrofolate reductase
MANPDAIHGGMRHLSHSLRHDMWRQRFHKTVPERKTMRKLIYSMGTSLDGYIETRDGEIAMPEPDEELHRFANEEAREMGAFLYGRRLYEVMAGYWPTADTNPSAPDVEIEFARIWKRTPKVVFSRTLEKVDANSRLVRDNVAEEIRKLKAEPSKNLGIGGANLAASAMQHDLIDEFRILVHPFVLGGGKPFFPDLANGIQLRLLETRTFGSGVVYLRYERADAGR